MVKESWQLEESFEIDDIQCRCFLDSLTPVNDDEPLLMMMIMMMLLLFLQILVEPF